MEGLCHELLSGTTLAGNEHRILRSTEPPNELSDLLHGWTLANDPIHRRTTRGLRLSRPATILHRLADRSGQLSEIVGFDHVVACSRLDPVNVTGWNENRVWRRGQEGKFGAARKRTLRAARRNALCPKSNWFELVASTDGEVFFDLNLRKSYDSEAPMNREFTTEAAGTLRLAANDLAHERDLIDKYDNNRGWIWVRVHRL